MATCNELCTCDMREVICVYPPGVVGLVLMAQHRSTLGLPTRAVLPVSSDVLNYMERIDCLSRLAAHVEFDRDVSYLAGNRRFSATTFTEVLAPEDAEFAHAADVIWRYLEREVPAEVHLIFSAFEEVLKNIQDHSAPDRPGSAFCCIQVQVYDGAIELAFGDLGVGFLTTLRGNPRLPPLADEEAALRGVLLHGFSRLAHRQEHRGGGLRRASDVVARLRGSFKAISRNGMVLRYAADSHRFCMTSHTFPGTLMWMRIPRGGA
jgi:hypothetical protein